MFKNEASTRFLGARSKFGCTARPRGTLPHGTLTLMGHCFEKGPKILRYTVLHCYLQHIIEI